MSRQQNEVEMQSSNIREASSEDEIPDTPRSRRVCVPVKCRTKSKLHQAFVGGNTLFCRPPTPVPLSPVQLCESSSDKISFLSLNKSRVADQDKLPSSYESYSLKHAGDDTHCNCTDTEPETHIKQFIVGGMDAAPSNGAASDLKCESAVNEDVIIKRGRKKHYRTVILNSSDSDNEYLPQRLFTKKATRWTKEERNNVRSRSLSFSDTEDKLDDDPSDHSFRKRKISHAVTDYTHGSVLDEIFNDLEANKCQSESKHKRSEDLCETGEFSNSNQHFSVPENSLHVACEVEGLMHREMKENNNSRKAKSCGIVVGSHKGSQAARNKPQLKLPCKKAENECVSLDAAGSDPLYNSGMKYSFPDEEEETADESADVLRSGKPSVSPVCLLTTARRPSAFHIASNCSDASRSTTYGNQGAVKKHLASWRSVCEEKHQNRRDVLISNCDETDHTHSAVSTGTSYCALQGQTGVSGVINADSIRKKAEYFRDDGEVLDKSSNRHKCKSLRDCRSGSFDLPTGDHEAFDSKNSDRSNVKAKHLNSRKTSRSRPFTIVSDDESKEYALPSARCKEKRRNPVTYIEVDSDDSLEDSRTQNRVESLESVSNDGMNRPAVKQTGFANNNIRRRLKKASSQDIEDQRGSSVSQTRKHKANATLQESVPRSGSFESPLTPQVLRHSFRNLDKDITLIMEVTGINNRNLIEATVSEACDHHGTYCINDVVDSLLNSGNGQTVNGVSSERIAGGTGGQIAYSVNTSTQHGPNSHPCQTVADELDPSYAAIMQDRINQFTDYQWKVHLAIHNGTDVPSPPECYSGSPVDSLVDSEVLQYLVHCRESGLAMPRRNTSRQVRRRGIARTCPWRSQNSVASSSSVTATGGQITDHASLSGRNSSLSRRRHHHTPDSWDEVTARRRSRSSVRVNSGAAANVSGRVQRPAVGRAQRQTDTPMDAWFEHMYAGYLGGRRRENQESDGGLSFGRRRRPRGRIPPSLQDLDEFDGMFNIGNTTGARQHDSWSLLSRTHLLDMEEADDWWDEDYDDMDGMFDQREQSGSWIRSLNGHLSLLSRTHLLDMDESDDVSDEYEHLLSIVERVGDAVPRGLESHLIGQLPTRLFAMSEVKDGEPRPECNICICEYEEGDRLRILQCLHKFHAKCIDKWLLENRTCPVCRVEIQV